MKGLRGLFRLGTLTLLALTLMVALALPSSAVTIDKVCSSSQMLDEVKITSVSHKEAQVVWSVYDLVNFDYAGEIENGLLEVKFKDIPTAEDFDGYVIVATPDKDDPGTSHDLGVKVYTSPTLIPRPLVVGTEMTEVLNLDPGTKYYVEVYAVNHNTVQISPKQRPQDQTADTTLLSAPFLGALDANLRLSADTDLNGDGDFDDAGESSGSPCESGMTNCSFVTWTDVGLDSDDYEGAHFAMYGVNTEAGQHYFRWLNPADYGPFDHVPNPRDAGKKADMLSFDKDAKVKNLCEDTFDGNGNRIDDGCGHTHYLFEAIDGTGNIVASELVETEGIFYAGDITATDKDYFQVVFTAGSGDMSLSVTLGRVDNGRFRPMSDTATLRTFEAPDDLRNLDQTEDEYWKVLEDIIGDYDENEDAERWLGENGNGSGRSIWNYDAAKSFVDAFYGTDGAVGGTGAAHDDEKSILSAHLNNQLN